MEIHLLYHIDRMVHELYMIEIRRELMEQRETIQRCRVWVETMLFTRNWRLLLQRPILYRVILSASLNPVHRLCYDRLVHLTKMTSTLHLITAIKPVYFSKSYPFSIIPILLW